MFDIHGYEYQCTDTRCNKKLIGHERSRVIICSDCDKPMELMPLSFFKHMNEYVAHTQMSFPLQPDIKEDYKHEYMEKEMKRKLGDFLMNEAGKIDIQEDESLHEDFKTYRASVAILSVDELKQFYDHIKRLEKEIQTLYET